MTPEQESTPEQPEPVIRDKRRIDPDTGQVRQEAAPAEGTQPSAGSAGAETPGATAADSAGATDSGAADSGAVDSDTPVPGPADSGSADSAEQDVPLPEDAAALADAAAALAAERLADLQRLQAEYVNYRKRVDRDRALARDAAIGEVVEALMPTMDEIALARQHGDLVEGSPFAAMAEKVEGALAKFGVQRYGEIGEEFDPAVHEALMHQTSQEVTSSQVSMVMQPGYRMGERVLRAARVGVTSPE